MNKHLLLFSFAFFLFYSCKTSHVVQQTSTSADSSKNSLLSVYDSMMANAFHFNTFTAKAKIVFTSGAGQTEFTASFRLKNDSAIWISISPALGIEAARVLITTDSVRVIDRLNKKYFSYGFDFFRQFTSVPLNYQTVQELVIGNPVLISKQNLSVSKTDSLFQLREVQDSATIEATLDNYFQLKEEKLTSASGEKLLIKNLQYDIPYNPSFSLWRKITLHREEDITIEATFSKVKIDEPVSFPFRL